jgi:hypothetical protein
MKSLNIIILILIVPAICFSQKDPIKFGQISLSELEMKVYEPDSSASAVVLCTYGHFRSADLTFTQVVRIKILKKEGYSWANWVFPTSEKGNIRGYTYNLENGEIIKEPLKKDAIFAERAFENYYRMRVAMPNVKVGSVVDIEFSYLGFPQEWRFQQLIPVKWSELYIENSPYFLFRYNFFGFETLLSSDKNCWKAKEMPAFKEEPYMNSIENYITKLEFDLSRYETSWTELDVLFRESPRFGGAIEGSLYWNDISKEILGRNLSNEGKIEAAWKAVKIVKWNQYQSCFATESDMRLIYSKKMGNSADINLMLLQLLRKLDFEAFPVVLSTRENGMLSPVTASLTKLNHVIVFLESDNKKYFLDATEDYMPFDLIPEKCLNWQGRLLQGNESSWVEIQTLKKDKEMTIYNLEMDNELNLTGKINNIRFDYAGYNFRKNYFSFNGNSEFIEDFIKTKAGLKILESEFKNIDIFNLPVEDKYSVNITDQVIQIGDEYYLYPLFYEQIKDNPFRIEERKYPIDFAYKREKTVMINITIPDNFEITEIPESIKMKMTGDEGSFLYQINALNNKITLSFKFSINQEIILPEKYADLKEFYNQIINKHSQPIILKKKV